MTPRREEQTDGLAAVVLGIAAFVFVTSSALWAAARASLWLTGRPGGRTTLEDATTFTIVLLETGDAAAAWERAYPDVAPLDPVTFWATLTVFVLLLVGIVGWAVTRWSGTRDRAEHAAWATRRIERKLAAPRDPAKRKWRLVAGRSRTARRLLAGHDCVSAVAFGPNGSGKTTGLVVPNVLDWDGPVVFTTAKPQDLEPVCSARAARGPVWVIAPAGAPGHDLAGWSPVDAAVDAEAADRIAEWMVDASGMAEDAKARPWNAQARKYLKGLLLAAHHSGGGVPQWIDWIHAGERARDHVEEALREAGEDRVAQDYRSTWQIHDEGKGSVLFTALGLADTYSRPDILSAATGSTLDIGQLFESNGTICVVTPSSNADRFAAYFTTLISAIIHEAETRAARQGGPLEPRLLLALDEAGNVFRYPKLPHLLTTARGNGIQLLLIYHDLAQLEHLYAGRDVARTVVSNAKLRLLLPGVGDLETLRYWSDLMGQARFEIRGVTTGFDGKRSRSRSEHTSHLAPLHQLQQLPDGQAVLLYQNLPPARIRLLPWFTDRRFRHLRESA